jgi:hypothetical protein
LENAADRRFDKLFEDETFPTEDLPFVASAFSRTFGDGFGVRFDCRSGLGAEEMLVLLEVEARDLATFWAGGCCLRVFVLPELPNMPASSAFGDGFGVRPDTRIGLLGSTGVRGSSKLNRLLVKESLLWRMLVWLPSSLLTEEEDARDAGPASLVNPFLVGDARLIEPKAALLFLTMLPLKPLRAALAGETEPFALDDGRLTIGML